MNALSYFDIYNNQSMLVEKLMTDKHDFYHGQIYLTSFYRYIPRIIWEGKTYVYGMAILNYEFFPAWAKIGYMPAFGLATLFADFGFLSIILSGFFIGFIRNCVYKIFRLSGRNNVSFLLYFYTFDVVMMLIMFMAVCISYFAQRK
jgi:hypothetical protein